MARLAPAVSLHILILAEGVTARYETREAAHLSRVQALHRQAREVAAALGAKEVRLLGLPDNRMDTVPLLDIAKQIEEVLEQVRPMAVFTHHLGDLNVDHRLVAQAVLTASRPVPGCSVRELYAFEVPSSTEWAFGRLEQGFHPNLFVDISDALERKLFAMALYQEEVRPSPHPRSLEALRARASYWGSVVGCSYAEAFEAIRVVW